MAKIVNQIETITAERKPDLRRKTGRMWIPIIQLFSTYIQRTRGWESDW